MKKKFLIILLLTIPLLLLIGHSYSRKSNDQKRDADTLISKQQLADLPQLSNSNIDISKISDELIPPTNKWYSGLFLQTNDSASFPSPLSFALNDTSFEVGLPQPEVTKSLIMGSHQPMTTAQIDSAAYYALTRYDELSIDVTYYSDSKKPIATITVTAGSPYVFIQNVSESTVNIEININNMPPSSANTYFIKNTQEMNDTETGTAQLQADEFLTLYMLPSSEPDNLKQYARNKITSTVVRYDTSGAEVKTTYDVLTHNNQPTALSLLPHHTNVQNKTLDTNFTTIYGNARTFLGQQFTYSVQKTNVTDRLNLSNVSKEQKDKLRTYVRRDINATNLDGDDTYFGAKAAYRASQLLTLAQQLEDERLITSISKKLGTYLDEWFSSFSENGSYSFYYDTEAKGIVGKKTAFGSEDFNDHHFHYGYFIYASSILAEYDDSFKQKHHAMIDLLVADIANYNDNEDLPLRRHYDPYFGHSWASGFAPFLDGNNQESVSEAINAWTATYLWANISGDDSLKDQSEWMIANEVNTAKKYWLNYDQNEYPYNQGYAEPLVSLNWGGKRDYATFFSPEPNAILGIQLIPMSPSFSQYYGSNDSINDQVQKSLPQNGENVQFSDYIAMYGSLKTNTDADRTTESIEEEIIDGANSRSYMYAWMLSNQK